MAENEFSFIAPHLYVDLGKFANSAEDLTRDEIYSSSYFETDHEGQLLQQNTFSGFIDEQEVDLDETEKFCTPMNKTPSVNFAKMALRRSISMDNMCLKQPLRNDNGNFHETNLIGNCKKMTKSNSNISNVDDCKMSSLKLNFQERINQLAQPKYKSSESVNKDGEFISMAEQIKAFERGTPIRFRTTPQNSHKKPQKTIPRSPPLNTKLRHRPVNALSAEEREELEVEEAKKYKFKANPINRKALQGPLKSLEKDRKPSTMVEPFNQTKCQPRKSPRQTEMGTFHAKPVPKSTHSLFLPALSFKPSVVPVAPRFMRGWPPKKAESAPKRSAPVATVTRPMTGTNPQPFSFEGRDKQLLKRKEENIKKVLEEERKAREFHANPLPKAIFKRSVSADSGFACNTTRYKPAQNNDDVCIPRFKARPAKVLQMKPFQPKHEQHALTDVSKVELNTDRRAREREEFEVKLKIKEMGIAALKEEEQRRRLQEEEEERANLRKTAVHKAQPIKKFKELKIQPSNKVTEPITPRFHYYSHKNKENQDVLQ